MYFSVVYTNTSTKAKDFFTILIPIFIAYKHRLPELVSLPCTRIIRKRKRTLNKILSEFQRIDFKRELQTAVTTSVALNSFKTIRLVSKGYVYAQISIKRRTRCI